MEANILKIVSTLSRGVVRLFRNNVGAAWMGKATRLKDGSVHIQQPRRVDFGLCKGSSDLIGFKTVEITPEMVGQKIAVFVAIETKDEKGKASEEQMQFIQAIQNAGGLAGIAKSKEDGKNILQL